MHLLYQGKPLNFAAVRGMVRSDDGSFLVTFRDGSKGEAVVAEGEVAAETPAPERCFIDARVFRCTELHIQESGRKIADIHAIASAGYVEFDCSARLDISNRPDLIGVGQHLRLKWVLVPPPVVASPPKPES